MLGSGNQSDVCHPQSSRTSSASLAPLSFSHVASGSHSALQPVAELDWMETGQHLTFIGHQVQGQAKQRGSASSQVPQQTYFGFSTYPSHLYLLCWTSLTEPFLNSVPKPCCNLSVILLITAAPRYQCLNLPNIGCPHRHLKLATLPLNPSTSPILPRLPWDCP